MPLTRNADIEVAVMKNAEIEIVTEETCATGEMGVGALRLIG